MNTQSRTKRDRIVRIEYLNVEDKPGLLSHYEAGKNLIHVDKIVSERLSASVLDHLMFTNVEYTQVSADRLTFEPYESRSFRLAA
jgi:hypothetical protein